MFGSPGQAAAASPNIQTNEMDGFTTNLPPMTAAQRAVYDQKVAAAAQAERQYRDRATARARGVAVAASSGAYVNTWRRRQTNGYYCGPTAVQVVSDWAWNMGPNSVKYTSSTTS